MELLKYTNKLVKNKIDSDMSIIIKTINSRIINVDSIILSGSFGRDEGSILINHNVCQPLNDYDLTVITNEYFDKDELEILRTDLASMCGIRQVDISLLKPSNIKKLNFTMANYDLFFASKVIYGDFYNIFKIPDWKPEDMPHKEAIVPLFLFLSSIIQSYPINKDLSSDAIFWSYQQITKSILGWSTAMLIYEGLYHPSYSERNKRFQEKFRENEKLCNLVNKATLFKLKPDINPCNIQELNDFWSEARKAHLESIKLLLPRFYNYKFVSWDYLIKRHLWSPRGTAKMILSILLQKHHYYDCLKIDIAKLYLCLSFDSADKNKFFKKSKIFLKKLSSYKKSKHSLSTYDEYIHHLIMHDKNANLFYQRGVDIFYE